jgi:hypothetical protein
MLYTSVVLCMYKTLYPCLIAPCTNNTLALYKQLLPSLMPVPDQRYALPYTADGVAAGHDMSVINYELGRISS